MTVTKSLSLANVIHIHGNETVDLGSVAANTSEEEEITITGVGANDLVIAVIPPSLEAGITLGPCRVSAANTLQLQVINSTGSAVDHSSEAGWKFVTITV